VADWTLITTTLGAALISGGFGYGAARANGKVALRQLESETTRTREQIEAENQRLRNQHREDHLRNRQGTYHAFLNVERELQLRFGFGAQPISREHYDDWAKRFFDLFNGVLLFGPETLRTPMQAVHDAHGKVYEEYINDRSSRPFGEKMKDAYFAHVDDVLAARETLVDAMREDVAPR
jgi:hypothetical protein